jgi:hypothetical protein
MPHPTQWVAVILLTLRAWRVGLLGGTISVAQDIYWNLESTRHVVHLKVLIGR